MPGETKRCISCNLSFPLTREFFGHVKKTGNHRSTCRKCESARVLAYKKANPETDRRLGNQRKSRLNGWVPSPSLKKDLHEEQGGSCALCGDHMDTPESAQIEHLMPTIQGGTNDIKNLVLAHAKCNQEKHGKNFMEYVAWRQKVGLPRSTFISNKILRAIMEQ